NISQALSATVTGAGQGLSFTNANSLTVASAGGAAITVNGGPLTLTTTNGDLTVANDIQNSGGTIALTAGGPDSTLTNNALIVTSAGSTVTLAANRMALAGGKGISSLNGGRVILQPTSAARQIQLGPTTDPTGFLSLSDAELDTVNTTGVMQVGSL